VHRNMAIKGLVAACAVAYLFSGSGCTTRGAYEAVRQNARNECYGKQSDAELARCLARTQDSFDEYRQKRAAVVGL
jgi:hypothetical protein